MPQYAIAVHPLLVAYPTAQSVRMYWEAALVSLHPTQDKIYITGFHRYKEPARQNYSEHEFLLAEIVCHVSQRKRCLLVERGPAPSSTSAQVFSTASSNLPSSRVEASDQAYTYSVGQAAQVVEGRKAHLTASYKCAEAALIPLFEWARILYIVSQHQSHYRIIATNCYWYAESIVAMVSKIYPHCEEQLHDGPIAGTWKHVKVRLDSGRLPMDEYRESERAHPHPKGVNPDQVADYAVAVGVMAQRLREHGIDPRGLEGLNPGMLDAGLLHAAALNIKCRGDSLGWAFAGGGRS